MEGETDEKYRHSFPLNLSSTLPPARPRRLLPLPLLYGPVHLNIRLPHEDPPQLSVESISLLRQSLKSANCDINGLKMRRFSAVPSVSASQTVGSTKLRNLIGRECLEYPSVDEISTSPVKYEIRVKKKVKKQKERKVVRRLEEVEEVPEKNKTEEELETKISKYNEEVEQKEAKMEIEEEIEPMAKDIVDECSEMTVDIEYEEEEEVKPGLVTPKKVISETPKEGICTPSSSKKFGNVLSSILRSCEKRSSQNNFDGGLRLDEKEVNRLLSVCHLLFNEGSSTESEETELRRIQEILEGHVMDGVLYIRREQSQVTANSVLFTVSNAAEAAVRLMGLGDDKITMLDSSLECVLDFLVSLQNVKSGKSVDESTSKYNWLKTALAKHVSQILIAFTSVVRNSTVSDTILIRLCGFAIDTFFACSSSETTKHCIVLQESIVLLLSSAFTVGSPEVRFHIRTDIIHSLHTLPTTKVGARKYRFFDGETSNKVQFSTILVLKIVQCCDRDERTSLTSEFVQNYINKSCSEHSEKESENILRYFVEDVLLCFSRPELPVSDLVLSVLWFSFYNEAKEDPAGKVSRRRLLCTELLGHIASSLVQFHKEVIDGRNRSEICRFCLQSVEDNSICDSCNNYIASLDSEEQTINGKELIFQLTHILYLRELSNSVGEKFENSAHRYVMEVYHSSLTSAETSFLKQPVSLDRAVHCMHQALPHSSPIHQCDSIVSHLCHIFALSTKSSSLRAKAFEGIKKCAEVDHNVMATDSNARQVITNALSDSSALVQKLALEILELDAFVLSVDPASLQQLCDQDLRSSVKKKIIQILERLLQMSKTGDTIGKAKDIAVFLAKLSVTEQMESMQKLLLKSLRPIILEEDIQLLLHVVEKTELWRLRHDAQIHSSWLYRCLEKSNVKDDSVLERRVDSVVDIMIDSPESRDKGAVFLHFVSVLSPQYLVKHAPTLRTFLEYDREQGNPNAVVHVCGVFNRIMSLWQSSGFVKDNIDDTRKRLHNLVYRSCSSPVANAAMQSLVQLVKYFNDFYLALKVDMFQRLYVELLRGSRTKGVISPHLMKYIALIGYLCRYINLDKELTDCWEKREFVRESKDMWDERLRKISPGCITESIYTLLLWYMNNGNADFKSYAYMSMGNVLICESSLFLRSNVLTNALHSPDTQVKLSFLLSLKEFFEEEDNRMYCSIHRSPKSKESSKVDKDSGVSMPLMQGHVGEIMALSLHKDTRIRMAVIQLISTTVSQGLIHAQQCLPNCIALTADNSRFVREKASEVVQRLESAVRDIDLVTGIECAFTLLKTTSGTENYVRGMRKNGHDGPFESVFLSLFSSRMRSTVFRNKTLLNAFFKSFVTRGILPATYFEEKCSEEELNGKLNFLFYMCEVIATVPVRWLEEPLHIVHTLRLDAERLCDKVFDNVSSFLMDECSFSLDDDFVYKYSRDSVSTEEFLEEDKKIHLVSLHYSVRGALVLVFLRQFLMRKYYITDEKLDAYNSSLPHSTPITHIKKIPFGIPSSLESHFFPFPIQQSSLTISSLIDITVELRRRMLTIEQFDDSNVLMRVKSTVSSEIQEPEQIPMKRKQPSSSSLATRVSTRKKRRRRSVYADDNSDDSEFDPDWK